MTYRRPTLLLIMAVLISISSLDAFSVTPTTQQQTVLIQPSSSSKRNLLQNLDRPSSLNQATRERTALVQALTASNPTSNPGSVDSFSKIAIGTWSVVYAPHIYKLGQGQIDPILYDLRPDGTMSSHARLRIPFIKKSIWFSVSGTYSSQDDESVSRVDFDKAWVSKWWTTAATATSDANNHDDQPYLSLDDVPDSLEKSIIETVGRWLFIDAFSIFPVSYLDDDTIVFDFDLLGTRICARKIMDASHWLGTNTQ